MPEKVGIWTPDGMVTVGGKKAEKVELRAGVMEWLRQFVDVAQALGLGMHCAKCGADLVGKNADTDKVFTVTCGCREFVGPNRDYRPETMH
jgi:hypothetical protein